jgi:hypothetical protein
MWQIAQMIHLWRGILIPADMPIAVLFTVRSTV